MILQINSIHKYNKQEEDHLQFLRCFGIFKESIKLILTWPKIFLQITLVSIFPQSCIILFNYWLSMLHFRKFHTNMSTFDYNQENSPRYNNILGSISKEPIVYLLINATFSIFSIIFSLISISTIVYTVACIYTDKKITFKKAISVVSKVWKPFMITHVSRFCAIFGWIFISVIWVTIFMVFGKLDKTFLFIGLLSFVVWMMYLSIIWQLSYHVSVMENIRGFKALKKSKTLVKGKLGTALAILLVLFSLELPILVLIFHKKLVGVLVEETICFWIISILWLTLVNLFALVTQTVFYFVCKSYHHENIFNSSLIDDVEGYLGEYVPITAAIIDV